MKFHPHVTDQLWHFAVAVAILSLASLGTALACAGAGLALGLIREASEAGGSRIVLSEVVWHFRKRLDPWIDLTFWALGGAVVGVVL